MENLALGAEQAGAQALPGSTAHAANRAEPSQLLQVNSHHLSCAPLPQGLAAHCPGAWQQGSNTARTLLQHAVQLRATETPHPPFLTQS